MPSSDHRFVEIPGYAEAIRREYNVRRSAWSDTGSRIAGVNVRMLTMRDVIALEELRNGYFVPFKFETDYEIFGHSAQFVWWMSDCIKPHGKGLIGAAFALAQRESLLKHLAARPGELVAEVGAYLADSFMDAPAGGSDSVQSAALAATPAYIMDTLAAGGHSMSIDDMLDMPLVRLWQILRLSTRRVFGTPITNKSDKLATDYLAAHGSN